MGPAGHSALSCREAKAVLVEVSGSGVVVGMQDELVAVTLPAVPSQICLSV